MAKLAADGPARLSSSVSRSWLGGANANSLDADRAFEGVPASLRPRLRTVSGAKWRVGEILPLTANQCHSQKFWKAVSPN